MNAQYSNGDVRWGDRRIQAQIDGGTPLGGGMSTTIRLRRGTSIAWATRNPILGTGEPGYETDTGRYKLGDGYTSWNARPYYIHADAISALIDAAIAASPGGGGGTAEAMIGVLSDLTTTVKNTIVGAINEVNTPPVPLTALYTNAKAG